jgi:hypothetical protein
MAVANSEHHDPAAINPATPAPAWSLHYLCHIREQFSAYFSKALLCTRPCCGFQARQHEFTLRGGRRGTMKINRLYFGLGAFAVLGAAIVLTNQANIPIASAQEVIPNQDLDRDVGRVESETADQTADEKMHLKMAFKASELVGMNVRGKTGDDEIGEINDLMIHRDGRVIYAAVSFGGFLGIGDKLFAVPFEAIEFVRDGDNVYARLDVTEQTLEQKEGFNQDKWPEKPSKEFRSHTTHRQVERTLDTDISR